MAMGSNLRRLLLLFAVAVIGGSVLAGCGGSSSSDSNLTGDGYPNVDLSSTRLAKGSIDTGNVQKLKVAWTAPVEGKGVYGSYAWAPIVINGVIYSQDLESNVSAIDAESGDVIWSTEFNSVSHGPNGLAVAEGRVYGATEEKAFALDQETGEELWSTPLHGAVDMAPGVHDGKVYVSTVPETSEAIYEAGAVGTLYALDAKTGKELWHFDTVPKNLWGKPTVNSGGGVWYPPSFDAKGDVYIGTGNPAPLPGTPSEPWGSSRPGSNLYADSMVKLDPDTGKVIWHYQQTPHNIYDWDFQDSPVMVKVGGKDVAVGAGKSGIVVAIDAKTGKPLWKTPVGVHNGHDQDGLLAMRKEYSKIKLGEVFPGELGGVIAPMATDGKTLYVPVVNHSMTVKSGSEVTEESESTGEVVAIDLATGKVKWKRELESAVFGAVTAVNDLVFTTTADGVVHALKAETGGEVWQGSLPAGTNAGVTISGDMLIAPAGLLSAEGQTAQLVAYKVGG
jgi:alcohol dehydrogenase (cytochrome c)